jgi:hypothetical protein
VDDLGKIVLACSFDALAKFAGEAKGRSCAQNGEWARDGGASTVLTREVTNSVDPAVTFSVAMKVSLDKPGVMVAEPRVGLPLVIVAVLVLCGAVWLTTVQLPALLKSVVRVLLEKVLRSLFAGPVMV